MLEQMKRALEYGEDQLFNHFAQKLHYTETIGKLIVCTIVTLLIYNVVQWILKHPKDKNRNIW